MLLDLYFKKVLSALLLPPGLFSLLLGLSALVFLFRRRIAAAFFQLLLGALIWALSTAPVADGLMRSLEAPFAIPKQIKGDVIVMLGGGIRKQVPDLDGSGFPAPRSLARAVTAARLYRRLHLPIVISGGQVYEDVPAEAPIVRRILVDLGIPFDKILIEDQSRDTFENARNTVKLCRKHNFSRPILITSAYHLKRALYCFKLAGLNATPFPADVHTADGMTYHWRHYLPRASALKTSCQALHELVGWVYYRLRYHAA